MQQFTRPITREIEVAGERLAVTFSAAGMSVRPVGSRKPPVEMTWADFLRALAQSVSQPAHPVTPEDLAAAVALLKKGVAQAAQPAPAESPPSREAPSAERKSTAPPDI